MTKQGINITISREELSRMFTNFYVDHYEDGTGVETPEEVNLNEILNVLIMRIWELEISIKKESCGQSKAI